MLCHDPPKIHRDEDARVKYELEERDSDKLGSLTGEDPIPSLGTIWAALDVRIAPDHVRHESTRSSGNGDHSWNLDCSTVSPCHHFVDPHPFSPQHVVPFHIHRRCHPTRR